MPTTQDHASQEPSLSVIIVAYKSTEEIRDCLSSLPRTVGGGKVECIVVNNSHGDGLEAIIATEQPWVRYINPGANLGFGRANNAGFVQSRGSHVLFLNPDTVSNAAAFEHCFAALKADPRIGLISPRLVMADGQMDLACRRSIPTAWDGFCRATGLAARFPHSRRLAGYNLTYLEERGRHKVGAINGAFMMSRRTVLVEVAGPSSAVFDESFFMYGDDLDLCIRVSRAGYDIIYDGSHDLVHLKGMSVGRDYGRMSRAIFDANRDVYLKHFNPGRSRWVALKYRVAFGLWKWLALLRARFSGHRKVRPV